MAADRADEPPHLRTLTCLCHSSHFQGRSGRFAKAQGDRHLFRSDRPAGCFGRPVSCGQRGGKVVSPPASRGQRCGKDVSPPDRH